MADFDDDNLKYDDDSSTDKNAPAREISADLIRGHINTIILRTLTDGEKYGTEIIDEIERKSHGQYTMKQPTLYSALKRLESQGFVTSYWGGVSNGGRRRYFNLTSLGREEAEKNIDEWEYSRTVIDCLISSRYFDLSAARENIREDNYDDVVYGDDLDGADSPVEPAAEEKLPEENGNMYSPSLPYFSHADEIINTTATDYTDVELPMSLLSDKAKPTEEAEVKPPVPDEPIYDFDSSADEDYEDYAEDAIGKENDEAVNEEIEEPEEEVFLPEDTARIYLDVSDDGYDPIVSARKADNIIDDVGATFRSEPENAEETADEYVSEENYTDEAVSDEETTHEEISEEKPYEEESSEEEPYEEETTDEDEAPTENDSDKDLEERGDKDSTESDGGEERERISAASALSDSEYRRIIRQSQIDRDYKKTLERIYSAALTDDNGVSDNFRPYAAAGYAETYPDETSAASDEYEAETENEETEETGDGGFKKILDENPSIRQENEDEYKIAGYQSSEIFDEHYAKTERVNINPDENGYTGDNAYPEHTEYVHPDQKKSDDGEGEYDGGYAPREEEERTFTRLPDDTSMPERENVSYTPGLIDVSDIIAQANADGIKISITSGERISASAATKIITDDIGAEKYSSTNRRARVKAALVVLALAIAEAIVVFVNMSYMKVTAAYPVIMIVLPLLLVIACALSARAGGAESKTLSVARGITAAVVIFMICVLAICAVSIAANVTLAEGGEILAYIVIPSVYSLNCVVYAAAYYGFARRDNG